MKMTMSSSLALTVGIAVLAGAAAQAGTMQPDARELTRAATQYLTDHGDLCMAKYTWPRDVTPADRDGQSNDAVQLPVLEHLGLVESMAIPLPATAAAAVQGSQPAVDAGRRYELTAKGRRYYLQKKHSTLNAHGQAVEHDADFCVAHLTLDKVVKWTPPEQVRGQPETLVRYTYHVEPAPWMADPDARKAFPVADRIIRGDRVLLMTMTARLEGGHWVPVLPGQ